VRVLAGAGVKKRYGAAASTGSLLVKTFFFSRWRYLILTESLIICTLSFALVPVLQL